MPEFYRNAWYAQLKKKVDELQEEIEKAIELPSVTSADEGKVLTVDVNGKWAAEDVPKELPVVQTTDEGKVLTVDNTGAWSAETLNCGNNFSTDEQVIGTWIDGKKLYQKTVYVENVAQASNEQTIATLPEGIKVHNSFGFATNNSYTYVALNYHDSDSYRCRYYIGLNSANIFEIRVVNRGFGTLIFCITVQYTKTI